MGMRVSEWVSQFTKAIINKVYESKFVYLYKRHYSLKVYRFAYAHFNEPSLHPMSGHTQPVL